MTKAKRGLAKEIIRLFVMGHTNAEIKRLVGCSTANVTQVLRRRGFTAEIRMARLQQSFEQRHRDYVEQQVEGG